MEITVLLIVFFFASTTFASDIEIDLLTIGQGYQTRTITGELLDRNRVTQWAGLTATRLWGVSGMSLDLQMRFDTDFGLWLNAGADESSDLELMNLVLRLDGLTPWLDLSLGRQVLLDEIDFLEFDGVHAVGRLPWGIRLGLLGGFAVRNRSWLGGSVLEIDGVTQGDVPAPVIGASLGLFKNRFSVEVDYRRVMLWDDGWPIESERMAIGTRGTMFSRTVGLDGSLTYDLAQDGIQRIDAGTWVRPNWPWKRIRIEANFFYLKPHFSLDSIFNIFSPSPFWQVRVGLRIDSPIPRILDGSLRLGFYHRSYDGSERFEGQDTELGKADGQVDGVQLDGRLSLGHLSVAWIYAGYEDGAAGRRWLLSPGIKWVLMEDTFDLNARGILLQVKDGYDSRYDVFNVGASAGGRWSFGAGRAVILSAELNSNRINPVAFRLLVVVDLSFAYGPGGYR